MNQMIKDTEDQSKIKAQNEQVAEMSAQLVQKEQEKKLEKSSLMPAEPNDLQYTDTCSSYLKAAE